MSLYKGTTKVAGNSAVHSHSNKNVLDNFADGANGLAYDGDNIEKKLENFSNDGTLADNKPLKNAIDAAGHTMLPTPGSGVTEASVVTAVNSAILTEGGANDDVASLFGVGNWSNVMSKTILVQGASVDSPIGTTGIGEWQEDEVLVSPTKAQEEGWGWIEIPELHGIASNNNVDVKLLFDPNKSGAIFLGGYIIDDSTDMMCIKFGNEISEEDTETAVVAIEITFKRTETRVLGS